MKGLVGIGIDRQTMEGVRVTSREVVICGAGEILSDTLAGRLNVQYRRKRSDTVDVCKLNVQKRYCAHAPLTLP
jgi:hypothetical protein